MLTQVMRQHLPGSPAEYPVQRVVHDSLHRLGVEFALGIILLEQQQADIRAARQRLLLQPAAG